MVKKVVTYSAIVRIKTKEIIIDASGHWKPLIFSFHSIL